MTREGLIDTLGDVADRIPLSMFVQKLCRLRGLHPKKFLNMCMFRPITMLYLLCKDAYYRLKHKLLH